MHIGLTYCPDNRYSIKYRGKTTLANYDHKQRWSVYDNGQSIIMCLLIPKHCYRVRRIPWVYRLWPLSFETKVH
jgi:hypothetical protein